MLSIQYPQSSPLLLHLEELAALGRLKELSHLVDEVLMNTVIRPSTYPLLSKPSFRPSEIMQGVYVGGFKDVTPEIRRSILRPPLSNANNGGGVGIRVYVCCCWAGDGGGGAVEKGSLGDCGVVEKDTTTTKNKAETTQPHPRRALLQTLRVPPSAKLQPSVVEHFTVPLVSYSQRSATTTTIDDAEDVIQQCVNWLQSSIWFKMNAPSSSSSVPTPGGDADIDLNGEDNAIYELHIKVPIEDEDTFVIEGPVTTTPATAPTTNTREVSDDSMAVCVGRGFLSVLSGILEALLAISSSGGGMDGGKESTMPPTPPRSFGIVIYCAAGKSRSVTILTSLLCRLLINHIHKSGGPVLPPLAIGTIVCGEERAGRVSTKVVSCVVASVLGYVQKRRTAACPNGGFRQALAEFVTKLLSTTSVTTPPLKVLQPKQELLPQ